MSEHRSGPDVAILLDHFGAGGVERVACHIANGLHRRGLRVEMVLERDAGPVRHLLDPDVSVHVLRTVRSVGRGSRLMLAVPDLAGYLRRKRPSLLHSPGNHTHKAAALAVRLSAFEGVFVPKITNPIVKSGMKPLKRWWRRKAFAFALAPATKVVVLSPSAIGRLDSLCRASKAVFLPNPYVSDGMLTSRGTERGASTPLVLGVGRLSKQKDFATLLRAAALLKEREWRLLICGVGPEADTLRALAKELGIADRVDLPGYVNDVASLYAEADVVVLSSRWEDLPATLVEAMACGCPVVATACSSAVVELMDAVGAPAPVSPGDPAALSVAIEKALDGHLPAVPPQAVATFGISAACDAHAALFSKLIAEQAQVSRGSR
ncbi:glycosyltransferase [Novosphingobium sp. M1R2S20]|uniref:Glycosyltransferase n=1 Tax=Novosphingobium rhizovicinum TaxID=3228928 RepID=A0ABV3RCW3_9SPHN